MERRRLKGRYLGDVVLLGPNLAQACNAFGFGVNISIVVCIDKSLLIVKCALNPKIQYKIQSKRNSGISEGTSVSSPWEDIDLSPD